MGDREHYILVVPPHFARILRQLKRRKPTLLTELEKQIDKILRDPIIGKPLRNVLKNYRRVHMGSFVLIYEIYGKEVRLIDFDHHDRIYKR